MVGMRILLVLLVACPLDHEPLALRVSSHVLISGIIHTLAECAHITLCLRSEVFHTLDEPWPSYG